MPDGEEGTARSAFVVCLYLDLPGDSRSAAKGFDDLIPEGCCFEIETVTGWTERGGAPDELRLAVETETDDEARASIPSVRLGGDAGNDTFTWHATGLRARARPGGIDERNRVRVLRSSGSARVSTHVKLVGHLVKLSNGGQSAA